MEMLILLLTMVTQVVAFDQIYAINAGGDDITDSDGIRYQKDSEMVGVNWRDKLDLTKIAKSDQNIYKYAIRTSQKKLEYNLPLESDGFYALIAKFSYAWPENRCYQNMTLNDEILLLPEFEVLTLCGGNGKICDVYMYFCVSDNTLYYKSQTTSIQDEVIRIGLHNGKKLISIAALVLLKGTLRERHTLKNSITNETLYFDPAKMNSICSTAIQQKSTITQNPDIDSKKDTASPNTVTKSSLDDFSARILKNITALVNHQETKIQSEIKAAMEHMDKDFNKKIEALQIEQASVKVEMRQLNKELDDIRQLLDTIAGSLLIKPR
jgi:uncharacterized protein YeeX (DUF496 family)